MNMHTEHRPIPASVSDFVAMYTNRERNMPSGDMSDAEVAAYVGSSNLLLAAAADMPVRSPADAIAALDMIIKEHPGAFPARPADANSEDFHFEETMGALMRSVRDFLAAQQQ